MVLLDPAGCTYSILKLGEGQTSRDAYFNKLLDRGIVMINLKHQFQRKRTLTSKCIEERIRPK
jgi:hypothetical protein